MQSLHVELVNYYVTTVVNTQPESNSLYYLGQLTPQQVFVNTGCCLISRYDTSMETGYAAHIHPRTMRQRI